MPTATKTRKAPQRSRTPSRRPLILTIGHSTRPIAEFLALLQSQQVNCLVDVRTIPRSRFNPQFNQAALAASLKKAGLDYLHLPGLGGLRHAHADSVNTGWRNSSFRGYADYMQTAEFTASLKALIKLAQTTRVAIMCAEAVPWRCHRSLIADALLLRKINVAHITGPGASRPHKITPFAQAHGTKVTYPPTA